MPISSLCISNFRNIHEANMLCSPSINIFYGMNAAGKTSLLETLYYLSTGKSFRTNQLDTITQHKANTFSTSILFLSNDGLEIPMGIRRDTDGTRHIRLNQKTISSITPISQLLPIQFIGTNCQSLLLDGPKARRQFLDWGLFHTNPAFYDGWKTFQKLLAQRNAALKARVSKSEMTSWDEAFINAAETLDEHRKNYLNHFTPYFIEAINTLLPAHTFEFQYISGWSDEYSLSEQLSQYFFREQQAGFSLFGPQRADLQIVSNKHSVQDVLSQGQQKLLSYALRIAQGVHLQKVTNKAPIYLIDDLPSELDHEKRALVFRLLSDINAQVFVTAIDADQLAPAITSDKTKLFHVKHGEIEAVSNITTL